ncbi:xanthine phosphoribosyltransferase [Peptostreptococcus russellii]|uniref:xanthine phosphoribosyltransferase n=1 Tax=Peptostreptococcus russellii TaxID=215200 RepID=UPI0029435123|nr:xanthine phosphoribosyltransferase [Peptostreptococcus russellii]
MELLKNKILTDGIVNDEEVLKVDNFLNHQIEVTLLNEIGKEFKRRFSDVKVDKILTVESSGIAIAVIAAQYFDNVPVVFAKKQESRNLDPEIYKSKVYSFTKNKEYEIMVSKRYISKGEKVLIMDDFLAKGGAALGMIDVIEQAGAELVGVGIVIEKSYQDGSAILKEKGVRVESLARIESLKDKTIRFK